jgi:tRNA(adenine34) deaminase
MPDDHDWMSFALAEAKTAFDEGEVPVGCIIVSRNDVVGTGHNRMEQLGNPCAHAEMIALKNSLEVIDRYALTGSAVYVTVEPCVMCLGAMMAARIPKVVYGTREPRTGACGSIFSLQTEPTLQHRIAVIGGIAEDACADLMRRFFEKQRNE